jgi:acyl-CoA thioesterase-1
MYFRSEARLMCRAIEGSRDRMINRRRSYGDGPSPVHRLLAPLFAALLLLSPVRHAAAEAPIHLVAFGDSLSAGYMLGQSDAFPTVLEKALRDAGFPVEVTNASVSGDTSTAGLARLDWSVPDGTDGVLLELGANDMLRGMDPQMTRQNLADMIGHLQARKIKVLLIGMRAAPSLGRDYVERFEAIYPELAKTYGVPLYPFFIEGIAGDPKLNLPDGMHPTPDGVRVIVRNILPSVEAFIREIRPQAATR